MFISILSGIAVNVLFSYLSYRFALPAFLDTIGTIVIGVLGGMFPGILTAFLTNVVCTTFIDQAYFFAFINILIAVCAASFSRMGKFKQTSGIITFALTAGVISGSFSSIVQQVLFGKPQNSLVASMSDALASALGLTSFGAFFIINLILNILDKALTTFIAFTVMRLLPDSINEIMGLRVFKQRPLSEQDRKSLREWSRSVKLSVRVRTALAMVGTSILLVLAVSTVCIKLFFDNVKEERLEEAANA